MWLLLPLLSYYVNMFQHVSYIDSPVEKGMNWYGGEVNQILDLEASCDWKSREREKKNLKFLAQSVERASTAANSIAEVLQQTSHSAPTQDHCRSYRSQTQTDRTFGGVWWVVGRAAQGTVRFCKKQRECSCLKLSICRAYTVNSFDNN